MSNRNNLSIFNYFRSLFHWWPFGTLTAAHRRMMITTLTVISSIIRLTEAATSNTVADSDLSKTPIHIRMGFMQFYNSSKALPFGVEQVGPAVDIAIEEAARMYNVHYEKFSYFWPFWCSREHAIGGLTKLYFNNKIQVVIGPGGSGDTMFAARFSNYVKLPQFTGVGNLVINKYLYPTLSRLSYNAEKDQAHFLLETLNHFGWYHTAIIVETNHPLTYFVGNIWRDAINGDERFKHTFELKYNALENYDLENLLLQASEQARGKLAKLLL